MLIYIIFASVFTQCVQLIIHIIKIKYYLEYGVVALDEYFFEISHQYVPPEIVLLSDGDLVQILSKRCNTQGA